MHRTDVTSIGSNVLSSIVEAWVVFAIGLVAFIAWLSWRRGKGRRAEADSSMKRRSKRRTARRPRA